MKLYSRVKILADKYKNKGVSVGSIGYIIEEYEGGYVEVEISNSQTGETIAQVVISIEDIELT